MSFISQPKQVASWAPTLVRLGVGSAMMVNGAGKLLNVGPRAVGIEAFAGYLGSLGVPFPVFFAWIAAFAEAGGGLLLVLGLFTRYAAVFIATTMAVAALLVHVPARFPTQSIGTAYTIGEYTWVLIVASVSLVFSGPGRLSLERAILGRELLPGGLDEEDAVPMETRPRGE